MKSDSEIKPVEVFAGTSWQAGVVKSLLENAEIEAYLMDEIIGTYNPWWTAGGGAGSVKVFFSNLDFENAKQVIAEFEKNMKEDNVL